MWQVFLLFLVISSRVSALDVADIAVGKIGLPYRSGGVGPDNFDCSGLVQYSFAQVGVDLSELYFAETGNHSPKVNAISEATLGIPVALQDIQRGDLLFYDIENYSPSEVTHVGIFVGSNLMVNAMFSKEYHLETVDYAHIDSSYWASHFLFARRIRTAPLWPMFQHDSQRTGRTNLIGPQNPIDPVIFPSSVTPTGGGCPAIGADGTVYVSSSDQGKPYWAGSIYALDADGLGVWWQKPNSLGRADWTDVSLAPNGQTVYAYDRYNSIAFALSAVDGSPRWPANSASFGTNTGGRLAIGSDESLYFSASSTSGGRMVSLYPDDGKTRWAVPLFMPSSPVLSPAGDILYATADYRFYALNALNGNVLIPPQLNPYYVQAMNDDGALYAMSTNSVVRINPSTGAVLWLRSLEDPACGPLSGSLSYAAPAIDHDGNIIMSVRHTLSVFSPNGTRLPQLSRCFGTNESAEGNIVVDGNNTIYVAAGVLSWPYAGRIIALFADGHTWSRDVESTIGGGDACLALGDGELVANLGAINASSNSIVRRVFAFRD